MKHYLIITFVAVACFTVYALFTGGILFSQRSGFSSQGSIDFAEELNFNIALRPQVSRFSLPFVFHYESERGPFSISLQLKDHKKRYRSIEIDEVVGRSKTGEVIRAPVQWVGHFLPAEHVSIVKGKPRITPVHKVIEHFGEFTLKPEDVTITIRGRLLTTAGEEVPFNVEKHFQYSAETHISTFWQTSLRR
jgi:hypothetical protein